MKTFTIESTKLKKKPVPLEAMWIRGFLGVRRMDTGQIAWIECPRGEAIETIRAINGTLNAKVDLAALWTEPGDRL